MAATVNAAFSGTPTDVRGEAKSRASIQSGHFVFLDICRAVAVFLVFYSHVARYWQDQHQNSPVVATIDTFVRAPLGIEQEFGYFGVALFFLVSGFVVTYRATREGAGEFAIKRVLRIYPAVIVVVLFVWLAGPHLPILQTGQPHQLTWFTILSNVLLVNYLIIPQVVLIGVAWTLIIEVLFYLLLLLLHPIVRKRIWVGILVELALCAAAVMFSHDFGNNAFLLAVDLSYIPVLLLGQICWAVYAKRISLWVGMIFGLLAWLVYVWAGASDMGRIDAGYDNAVALALLLFILGILLEPRLHPPKVFRYLADRSYSIYLLQGVIAFPVLAWMGFTYPTIATIVAVAATMVVVEVTFRFVERPTQRLARLLARRRRIT